MAEEIRRHEIATLIGEEDITSVNIFCLGEEWVRKRFLFRNPDLASVTSATIDSNRVKDNGIEKENIYNMDESSNTQ